MDDDKRNFLEQVHVESDVSEKSDVPEENNVPDENGVPEIANLVSIRASIYGNLVLASQIQKSLSISTNMEKRGSVHAVLQELSVGTPKQPESEQKLLSIQLKKTSVSTLENTVEEYAIPDAKNQLLADSYVRNLTIPIREKRNYRDNLLVTFKRKHWCTKLSDCTANVWENFVPGFEIWFDTLNVIEGQFGTAVASYFFFLRWLLYMNIFIFLLNFFFLVLPQSLFRGVGSMSSNQTVSYFTQNALNTTDQEATLWGNLLNLFSYKEVKYSIVDITNASSIDEIVEHCSQLYHQYIANDTRSGVFAAIQNFLQGTGPLESTYLFTGFYTAFDITFYGHVHNVAFTFLCVLSATFIGCFIMMIHYTSVGVQETFVSLNKQSHYSNEVFSAWEYCINDPITADRQHYQFILKMKTNLHEDRVTKEVSTRSTATWVKLYTIRIFINMCVITWLLGCCYGIYSVAVYQLKVQQEHQLSDPGFKTFSIQFLSSLTIIILNGISPTIFNILVSCEKYSDRMETNLSILRNLFLFFASITVLLSTFYQQIACKPKDICGRGLSIHCRSPRCWETYVGQQLFKLSLTDMFVNIAVFLCNDALKYYISQKCNNKCTRLLGYPAFFLPTEVLAAVNSQTVIWLGVFYSPLLPTVMIFKLVIIFYMKKTKILKFCEPPKTSYRASRSNAVFSVVLVLSFFVVFTVQNYAIESIPPSRGCGPFRDLDVMTKAVPESIRSWLSVLTSYWALVFAIFVLCVGIYYYWREIDSQKELIKRLKGHLVLESHDKQFLLNSIAKLTGGQPLKSEKN